MCLFRWGESLLRLLLLLPSNSYDFSLGAMVFYAVLICQEILHLSPLQTAVRLAPCGAWGTCSVVSWTYHVTDMFLQVLLLP